LTDAFGRVHGHAATILDIVSPTPGRVLLGQAATIRFVPFREDVFEPRVHGFARHFYRAVGAMPAGKVLVLAAGRGGHSVGGSAKLSRLQNLRLAGLVTDGRLRDFQELSAYDPVFYCRGETPRAGTGDLMPIAANEPVMIDGVTIVPGDYVFADQAGALVIPASTFIEVVNLAAEIQAEDIGFIADIRKEDPELIRSHGSAER